VRRDPESGPFINAERQVRVLPEAEAASELCLPSFPLTLIAVIGDQVAIGSATIAGSEWQGLARRDADVERVCDITCNLQQTHIPLPKFQMPVVSRSSSRHRPLAELNEPAILPMIR